MKLFIRREGGQIPTFSPAGEVETTELDPELAARAERAVRALQEGGAPRGAARGVRTPDTYLYSIVVEEGGVMREITVDEMAASPEIRSVLHALVGHVIDRKMG